MLQQKDCQFNKASDTSNQTENHESKIKRPSDKHKIIRKRITEHAVEDPPVSS